MSTNYRFQDLVGLCRQTHNALQQSAARAVDNSLAIRNWLFGRYIVEYEQNGADRAVYGKMLIPRLAAALAVSVGKGFSERNLDQFRKFYRVYREIPQTASAESMKSRKSETASRSLTTGRTLAGQLSSMLIGESDFPQTLSAELSGQLRLGWSHYVELLTIDNPDERQFYEFESFFSNNNSNSRSRTWNKGNAMHRTAVKNYAIRARRDFQRIVSERAKDNVLRRGQTGDGRLPTV